VTEIHIRGIASTGLGYDPLMTRKSPVGGLRPAYRVYLVSFALGVAALASFVAHVKVLGFVFVALMFAFAGITTVMLLALARQAKADLRATPRAPGKPTSPRRGIVATLMMHGKGRGTYRHAVTLAKRPR
jgi:hypothetical protein